MDYWSGGLRVSVGHLKPEKQSWNHIQCGFTDGNPIILSYENAGDIHLTKICGEQVATKKLNPHLSKKVTGVWKNQPGDMTKQTKDLQNKIQECNNLLKRLSPNKECVDGFMGNFVGDYKVCATCNNPVK